MIGPFYWSDIRLGAFMLTVITLLGIIMFLVDRLPKILKAEIKKNIKEEVARQIDDYTNSIDKDWYGEGRTENDKGDDEWNQKLKDLTI